MDVFTPRCSVPGLCRVSAGPISNAEHERSSWFSVLVNLPGQNEFCRIATAGIDKAWLRSILAIHSGSLAADHSLPSFPSTVA